MKLTKQQIEALTDLYEVMEKHGLSFDPSHTGEICILINERYLYAVDDDCVFYTIEHLVDKNKGGVYVKSNR